LIGDDDGTAETAAELGVRHIPDVARSGEGTPLVNDIFAKGRSRSEGDLSVYVNSDIILTGDIVRAISSVSRPRRAFLMVGRRWDLDVQETLSFGPSWEHDLRTRVANHGSLHEAWGIDYFAFSSGLWDDIPPFAIGRTAWDNWLIYDARATGAIVVDATADVLAVHQSHDYGHHPSGEEGIWKGAEAQRNRELAGGAGHAYTLDDATHVLRKGRLSRNLSRRRITRAISRIPVIGPGLSVPPRAARKGLRMLRRAAVPFGESSAG
jgi:hypothetical protein